MTYNEIHKNVLKNKTPLHNVQCENLPSEEIKAAEDIIDFLSNKRVLFNEVQMENGEHCGKSAIEIRNEITEIMKDFSRGSYLNNSLNKIRNACQKLNDKLGHPKFNKFSLPIQRSMMERELYIFREKVGSSLAEISITYGLDIPDYLAIIIPFDNFDNLKNL